jgi:hypothetical protein
MTRLAAAVLALALTGCADPATVSQQSPSPTPSATYEHDVLVLQVWTGGGFVPSDWLPGVPQFSLYGDGRVFTLGPVPAIYPGPAMPNVQVATVSRETVARIAREAREAGVDGVKRDYGQPNVADAGTTTFRLRTESGYVEASVYALGIDEGAEQNEARKKLAELNEHLTDLNGWLGAGTVGDSIGYDPSAVAIYAQPYELDTGEIKAEIRAWRGPDPAAGEKTRPGTCSVLTDADLGAVIDDLRKSNIFTRWTYEDAEWRIRPRPLLPDERTCADQLRQFA